MLDYILRDDGHKVEEIYSTPSANRHWEDISSQHKFGPDSEGIQLEASEYLG